MKINSTLVIDDNLGDRVLIERVLKAQHPEMLVDHASNYYSAFDFLKMAPYNLLIIDLNMPGRGGVDFFLDMDNEKIKKVGYKIILSGANIDPLLREILTDRVDRFVTKDIGMQTLANVLTTLKRYSA